MLGRVLLWYQHVRLRRKVEQNIAVIVKVPGKQLVSSVYLVDCCATATQLRRKLVAASEHHAASLGWQFRSLCFGWIELWTCEDADPAASFAIEELPAVWNHQLVTDDSVQVRP